MGLVPREPRRSVRRARPLWQPPSVCWHSQHPGTSHVLANATPRSPGTDRAILGVRSGFVELRPG